MAAAMHFFSLSSLDATPSSNALPLMDGKTTEEKWKVFSECLKKLVARYVLVDKLAELTNPSPSANNETYNNPHALRIAMEHDYCRTATSKLPCARVLPNWLLRHVDEEVASDKVREASSDGVFNYASAVLNDGLMIMNLRDAIHEGDGPRIIRCWKFMLLHWWHAKVCS